MAGITWPCSASITTRERSRSKFRQSSPVRPLGPAFRRNSPSAPTALAPLRVSSVGDVRSGDGHEAGQHHRENIAAYCRRGDDCHRRRPTPEDTFDDPSVHTLTPRGHRRPLGNDGFHILRSVAAEAPALVPEMGASSRCGRCVHAGHHVPDIRSLHSARCATVLGGERPLDRVAGAHAPCHAHRALDRADRDSPAEGSRRARSEHGVRARAQRARAAGTRCSFASAAGASRSAFPVQYARERAGAR